MISKHLQSFVRIGMSALLASTVLGFSAGSVMAEKVLRVAPHADLKNLDPIWTTAYITRNHGYMVYDTLIAMDGDLNPQPQMLEGWDVSDDGLTYTFDLLQTHRRALCCKRTIESWNRTQQSHRVRMQRIRK